MPIIAKESTGGNFDPIPAGTHMAICYSIIDLGVQINEKFNVKSRKVMVTWELPDETILIDGEEKPRAISKEYTLSLGERANLRKELEAWRGRAFTKEELAGFDLKNVLGKACQLQIIHKVTASGNTRAQITATMGLPKGYKPPECVNPNVYFALDDAACVEQIETLPEWIQGKIKQSETWKEVNSQHTVLNTEIAVIDEDDGCPF